MKNKAVCITLILLSSLCQAAETLKTSLTQQGVQLSCGSMGDFTVEFPEVHFKGGEKKKPVETRIQGKTAELTYAGGGTLEVSVSSGKLSFDCKNLPADADSLSTALFIAPNYSEGGHWFADNAEGVFPKDKPAKPHLYQNHSRSFGFTSIDNQRLNFGLPEYTYVQLQDNREWNWNIFWLNFKIPLLPGRTAMDIAVAMNADAVQRVTLVDRFGQTTRKDFPDKIADENTLKADVTSEQQFYASLKTPHFNSFGGFPGSGKSLGLKNTGFFHVEKKKMNSRDLWVLVDPAGEACFHLGICTFGPGEDYTSIEKRESVFEWMPSHNNEFATAWHPDNWWNPRAVSFYKANVIRKYGSPYNEEAQTSRLVDRVRSTGFNAVGAFSGNSPVFKEKNFPRVQTLPLSSWTLAKPIPGLRGIFDPFDRKILDKMDQLFADKVAEQADDKLIIGYFLDNEQAFEDIPRAIPALIENLPCKKALIEMLKDKYHTIEAFNKAWGLEEQDFDILLTRGIPVTTRESFSDMQDYTVLFLEKYYSGITSTFKKYDKNHMLIGNRWQPGTANNETLCRIAGRYMDVISINYYTCAIDKTFIKRLYEWTGGRPQMWSEFYFTSEKESNVAASNNDLPTQQERGLAYRHYVENAASSGFVVGIEWFTLIDQAVTGRFFEGLNGERANTGLFNVADRPYKPLLREMAKTNARIYDIWLKGEVPYQFEHPRFNNKTAGACRTVSAGRSVGEMQIDGLLTGWPGRPPERIGKERLAAGGSSEETEGSFKLCWNDENLFLLVDVTDATPMINEKEKGDLWNGDVIELFIGHEKPEAGGPLLFTDRQILLGAAHDNQFFSVKQSSQPAIRTAVIKRVDGKGYTIEAAIPWNSLEIKPEPEKPLLFDIAIGNCSDKQKGRFCQLVWNGKDRNSTDRSAWGRLKLVP